MEEALLKQKIDSIFNKILNQKSDAWNLNINQWDWSCGVGLFGLVKAFQATRDVKYKEFIRNWFDKNGESRYYGSVNNVAPVNAVLFLLQEYGDEYSSTVCKDYAVWCMKYALRTTNGGFAHIWIGGDEDYKNQLWIDTIFMAGVFMLKYGVFTKNDALIKEALKQIDLHIECLIDPVNDLFYHGYQCIKKIHMGEHWGRGNGWMIASLVELIEVLKDNGYEVTKYIEVLKRVMKKAYDLKTEDGMLRTLLLVEESYKETTATSLFGYAALKGFQMGVLDERFLEWGNQIVKTVTGFIAENGAIAHCSYGTNPESREVYMTRPCDQSLYADGIVLMLLAQAIHHK